MIRRRTLAQTPSPRSRTLCALRFGASAGRTALLATFALMPGCDAFVKAPDANYATVRFEAYLKSTKPQPEAEFGQTVALDETSLAVTAPFEDVVDASGAVAQDAGALYVFDLERQTAPPLRLIAPNTEAGDGTFPGTLLPPGAGNKQTWGGTVVALDTDWIAVGRLGEDSALAPSDGVGADEAQSDNSAPEAGAVYVYRRSDLAQAPKYIKAPSPKAGHLFGFGIALAGGWLAVGAAGDASSNPDDGDDLGAEQSGAVFMYRYDTDRGDFVFQQYLKAPRIHALDMFGNAISIEGDLMVIGASQEDGGGAGLGADIDDTSMQNAGAVYTYRWTGTQWAFESYLKAAAPNPGMVFGTSVRVIDGRIAVGAPLADRCPKDATVPLLGVAYVISRTHGEWADLQCLSPAGRAPGGLFGFVLSGYGTRLVLGAPWEPPRQAGAAYVFDLDESGTWKNSVRVVAPNREGGDAFGMGVGINSKTIAVAAMLESGASSGPKANLSNNAASHSGAAYLFSQ